MANGLTSATKEDGVAQARRFQRGLTKRELEVVGWSIGRGYEADYLEAIHMSELVRYSHWLKSRSFVNANPSVPCKSFS